MISIPFSIQKRIGEKKYTLDEAGMSGSRILIFDDMVLKIQEQIQEAENEIQMMKWLHGKLPVPEVLCYEETGGLSYLLMTKIKGKMTCDDEYLKNPQTLTWILADGLKKLWDIDISQCPCRNDLDRKLEMARYYIEHDLVDMDNVEPNTFGENGFASPQQLLEWLIQHRPSEEMVLSHGDFCLPNILAEDMCLSGFIDLGRMGVADRWQDIALCYRSLRDNYAGKYGGSTYAGFDPNAFFARIGVKPDWEKIKYYILLDELF